MSTSEPTFHCFSRLPLELREQIWRYCLPYRIRELDVPVADNLYWGQPQPCQLQRTSSSNSQPPLIARVCYESRKVAHETGVFVPGYTDAASADWYTDTAIYTTWQDPLRESLHLNWARVYEADFHYRGDPLEHLVRLGQGVTGNISLTGEYLFQTVTKAQDLQLLKRRASWSVVVRTIIVHSDTKSAAATGLFGLLGDSRVQIIDVGDAVEVKQFMDFAESCERGQDVTAKQDFRLETVWTQAELLRKHVLSVYGKEMVASLRPAVMFRLCTQMCNNREVQAAQEQVRREPPDEGRGRVRGRVSRVDVVVKGIWKRLRG